MSFSTLTAAIDANPDENWDYEGSLSNSSNITLAFVKSHPTKPWSMYSLSHNSAIPIADIITDMFDTTPLAWNMDKVSCRSDVTMQIVLDNIGLDWNFINLSRNSAISIDDVRNNIDLAWDFVIVTANKGATLDDLTNHPTKGWCYKQLCCKYN